MLKIKEKVEEKKRDVYLRLEENDENIFLEAIFQDERFCSGDLLKFNKKTLKVSKIKNVNKDLGFELDEYNRLVIN